MRTRQLGNTDLYLTTVGIGTWAIGGRGWGPQDDNDSVKTLLRGLELGVNWIDTAAVYGFGHSEEIVGKAIKEAKHRPYVFTKCGRIRGENDDVKGYLKKESIHAEVDASLMRLGVDMIDLYQMHWPDPPEDIEEGWEAMAELVQEGKVRYIGVSNFNTKRLKRIQPIHSPASLQPSYSMLRREAEDAILGFCEQNNIGVIVYSPMERGLLTGTFTKERISNLPEDDHRRHNSRFQEPELSANLNLVEGLRPIAQRNNRTLPQLAIAWVLRRPEVTGAIVGSRRPEQIEDTVQAGDWELSDEDIEKIETLLKARKEELRPKNRT